MVTALGATLGLGNLAKLELSRTDRLNQVPLLTLIPASWKRNGRLAMSAWASGFPLIHIIVLIIQREHCLMKHSCQHI